jgi:hypothetical protein
MQLVPLHVGALYPEYHVRTMPADALEPDGIPGRGGYHTTLHHVILRQNDNGQ